MGLRPLGRTGLLVSPIGLGTVKFGRNTAIKYPAAFELPGDAAIAAMLARASELGINLLDTAPAYGVSEARLGKALARQRDRWIIVDKAGEEFDGKVSRFDFSPSAIVASVERSLKRLRTDRIDVLLLHSDGEDETLARFGPAIDALERLKQAGKLIATGFSGKTVEGGLMGVAHTDVVMITLNPGATADRAVAAAARQAGKGVLVKKALDSGNLVSSGDPVRQAMELIFAEPGVSCVVIGTLNAEHLAHDVAAARQAIERAGHGG